MDQALSDAFSGVLVSDCYAAYHHYDGPKQRCWAHLLSRVNHICRFGVKQFCRFTSSAWPRCWAALVR